MSNTLLNLTNIPPILGDDLKPLVRNTMALLQLPRAPMVVFVGPPGSGKTHIAKAIAATYALSRKSNARYVVMDTESTKSGLIAGKEIQNGSLVTVQSAIAEAMVNGDVIVIDELGHAPDSIPPMLNTISDQDSTTYAGGMVIKAHKNFRMIVCTNRAGVDALNSPFAPSFASRPIVFYVGYPDIHTETAVAKRMAMLDLYDDVSDASMKRLAEALPDSVIRYVASLVRLLRDGGPALSDAQKEEKRRQIQDLVPVSARNMANILVMLAILPRDKTLDIVPEFTKGNQESHRRMVIQRVFWTQETRQINSTDLSHAKVLELLRFVSQVGIKEFKDAVLSGVGYHLDIAGVPVQLMNRWREMASSTII